MTMTQPTIFQAASMGDIDAINAQLSNGAKINDMDENGLTMVHHAALHNQLKTLEFLKNNAADLSATTRSGNNAIHIATARGYADLVEFFINNRVLITKSNTKKETPLHLAAQHGYREILALLLQKDTNKNYVCSENNKSCDAAKTAIIHNQISCLEHLLSCRVLIDYYNQAERLRLIELAIQYNRLGHG